jgi:Domain of unknown function (DUF1905)
MKFRSYVEPPEPMRGLEVPPEIVEALGGCKRAAVSITINGHSWKSRVAIMRGRYLLGLSNANRKAAGVVTGDEVEVEMEIDAEPRVVVEPADFARALDADPIARTAYDRLSYSPQAGARARHREREEGRDAHTADREGPGQAAGPGVGTGPCGPRQDSRPSPLTPREKQNTMDTGVEL